MAKNRQTKRPTGRAPGATKALHPTAGRGSSAHTVERVGQPIAVEMNLEWVEVTFQKESRGMCLCIYLDKEGGLTLDDCERFHKRVQPLLDAVDYDFLEVSSPGIDRPIKTQRDFEKNKGKLVEVKLYAPVEGAKLHRGFLRSMDDESVALSRSAGDALAGDTEVGDEETLITFNRSAVAIIKPIIDIDMEGMEDDG